MMKEFNLTHAQAGILATAFFYAYTIMQLPAGHIGDRVGKKKILALGSFIWSLMAFLTSLATSFYQVFVLRLITGLGEGTYFGNDRPVIAAFTPKDKMGKGQGISFTGLGIGMGTGILLGGLIAQQFGWRSVFLAFSIPSLLAFLLIMKYIREPEVGSTHVSFKAPFKSKDLWLLNIGGIAVIYALWVIGTWAPKMFLEIGVESLGKSSVFASLFGFAAIPGLFTSGYISDRFIKYGRKFLIALYFFLLAIVMFLTGKAMGSGNVAVLSLLVFVDGFFVWGIWAPIYALVSDVTPKKVLGTTFGFVNFVMFFGSLIAPWLTGWVRDLTGSFTWGCYLAAIVLLVGMILILLIRPAFQFKPETPIEV
jgi:MFS family permease